MVPSVAGPRNPDESVALGDAPLSLDQALALLEKIADEPGIVGITARFARTRALLRWTP